MNGKPTFEDPCERIIIALDFDELPQAEKIITELSGLPVTYKIGNQLGTYEGWQRATETIHNAGAKIFCDTKFKDIPNTVEKSARAITRHQPDMFNIMADNNPAALAGAVKGIETAMEDFGVTPRPILLGVTVLTSISDEESHSIYGNSAKEKVIQFASAAAKAGIDGVVCSPLEAELLRAKPETENLLLVCPGIRPEWSHTGDQSRICTPKQAVEQGVDYLVIGRPITQPVDSVGSSRAAVEKIREELS